MTSEDTFRVRQQLLNVLRAADRPLSTRELAELLPPKIDVMTVSCAMLCDSEVPSAKLKVLECHSSWHIVERQRSAQDGAAIYPHLRSLARQSLIRRIPISPRSVLWEVVHDNTGD
ncbi:hypothetical protein [Mycolicibacterium fallax]|uniref:Uncharacterized protein n=1 Tax=Mycolicibacterium fallax TaxID=1793 RepID=A0A1X1RK42_MYCFA|nr:hypothetical protein [Mycolicibacterium fallax]ORV08038.1 hypothetical protein AWC04_02510 [Mycolicibacterium fallax]